MSATDGFGLKNQGLSVDQQVEMLAAIVAGRANAGAASGAAPKLSATLSCVWGCPFDGEVGEVQVADLVGQLESGLADRYLTAEMAETDPAQEESVSVHEMEGGWG